MSSLFNFGGPGWFNDVVEVDIILDDSTRRISLKTFLGEQTLPLFGAHERVQGKLKLRGPPGGRTVSHYGITVELESSLQFYESLNSVQYAYTQGNTDVRVAEPGQISGEVDVPFEFDLGKLSPAVHDTYDGEKFDVRHTLIVTVLRPWYTFNVTKTMPIALQVLSPQLGADGEAGVKQQLAVVPRTPLIEVDDCGGKVSFAYGRPVWGLGETIEGDVVFAGPLDVPVVACKLVLYKIEVADGENAERTVKELDIVGGSNSAQPGPVPVEGGVVRCSFPLTPELELTPTLVEMNPMPVDAAAKPAAAADDEAGVVVDENTVNVHYYLRLLVEGTQGKKSWNTHEVILQRTRISTGVVLPSGVV